MVLLAKGRVLDGLNSMCIPLLPMPERAVVYIFFGPSFGNPIHLDKLL